MQHGDFKVGGRFNCGGKLWLCTDLGARTVIAVCLTVCRTNNYARALSEEMQDRAWEGEPPIVDPSWLDGPPYALAERVFDEYDVRGCNPENVPR